MHIVTAASQNHLKTLVQFINSFLKFYIDSKHVTLIVYDLGIETIYWEDLKNSTKLIKNIIYKVFDYSKYPSYLNVNINAGEYAWKPVIIYDTCVEFNDIVIWFDSGNLFLKPLDMLHGHLLQNHLYSAISGGNILRWTHPKTIEFMNCDMKMLNNPNRNAACVAFNYNTKWVKEFVKEWKDLALTKQCIAPEGSSRLNHRQDQAVLTILYYKYQEKYNFVDIPYYLDFTIHNDCD